MKCKHCSGKGTFWGVTINDDVYMMKEKECMYCKGVGKMSIDNLPDNFSGVEGQKENTYLFHIQIEFAEKGEGLSEEEAYEELMGRTVRELLEYGTGGID